MEARVKQDQRWNTIKAFSGQEFNKDEWRPVPNGFEKEAAANEFLETRGSSAASKDKAAGKAAAGKSKDKAAGKAAEESAVEGN